MRLSAFRSEVVYLQVMNCRESIIGGKVCRFFESGQPSVILLQPSARHETATLLGEAEQIAALSGTPFLLVAFDVDDWMVDLMPWPDKNISRKEQAGKRGTVTLDYVLLTLLPEIRAQYGPVPVIFGGYSLGGLFALWASSQTDTFTAVAAASPSVWIEGWIPYADAHPVMASAVYLSLGKEEEHVKNRAIKKVGNCLRKEFELLVNQLGGECCTLVWEEGNHFTDNEGRLARAFAGIILYLREK